MYSKHNIYLAAVHLKLQDYTIFQNVSPCTLVDGYQCFGGTC